MQYVRHPPIHISSLLYIQYVVNNFIPCNAELKKVQDRKMLIFHRLLCIKERFKLSFSYPQERSRRRSSPPPETTSFQSAAQEETETSPRGQTRNHNVAQVTDSGNSHVNLNIDSAIDAHSTSETQSNEGTEMPSQGNQSGNISTKNTNNNSNDVTNQLLVALLPFLTNALGNAAQAQLQHNQGNTNQE